MSSLLPSRPNPIPYPDPMFCQGWDKRSRFLLHITFTNWLMACVGPYGRTRSKKAVHKIVSLTYKTLKQPVDSERLRKHDHPMRALHVPIAQVHFSWDFGRAEEARLSLTVIIYEDRINYGGRVKNPLSEGLEALQEGLKIHISPWQVGWSIQGCKAWDGAK